MGVARTVFGNGNREAKDRRPGWVAPKQMGKLEPFHSGCLASTRRRRPAGVTDFHQTKPLRLGSWSRFPAVTRSQDLGYAIGPSLPPTHLEQGPYNVAHHVVQKTVTFDPIEKMMAATGQLRPEQCPATIFYGSRGSGKTTKVMVAQQLSRCQSHGRLLEPPGVMISPSSQKGGKHGTVVDMVTVEFAPNLALGMEIAPAGAQTHDPDVAWQAGIEG